MGIPDRANPPLGNEDTARQIPPGQSNTSFIASTTPESTSSPMEPGGKRTPIDSEESPLPSFEISNLDVEVGQGSGEDAKSTAAEKADSICGGQETSKQPDVEQRSSPDKTFTARESATSGADIGENAHTDASQAELKDTYAFKMEEERWRKKMYKVFQAIDHKHRHAVSSALTCLRRSPQWRCADLAEKIKQNQAEITRVGIRYIAKSSHASDKDDHAHSANPRPLKREWVRRLTSQSSQSTVTPDRGHTEAGRSRSAAWVQSLATPPSETTPSTPDDFPNKRLKASRGVTGVLRDFTKPFESPDLPREEHSIKPTAAASKTTPEPAAQVKDDWDKSD